MPVKVNAKVRLDNTGNYYELPVILVDGGGLKSHLQYLANYRSRSMSWTDRSAFAVCLLLEFWGANEDAISDPKKMFREFSLSLFRGTISSGGDDPSNLRWLPRRESDARQLIGHITHYCDWLAEVNDDENLRINPKVKPDSVGERMNIAAHYHRKRNAFFAHLFSKHPDNRQRAVQIPRSQTVFNQEPVKFFPEGRMGDLLAEGFVRRGFSGSPDIAKRLNLRDMLITMLMYYGGLRVSECFHIWVNDISNVDGECIVKVYHPSQGLAPDGSIRSNYLQKKFGLRPRDEYPKRHIRHAGWKDPALSSLSGKYFVVNWFPLEAGNRFMALWALYLQTQYEPPRFGEKHPYAFTTQSGDPYSIKAYTGSRQRAVERIGLEFSKRAGTTAHGDRHAYGQALKDAGLRKEFIQKAMHHRSPDSQAVYTEPTQNEMRDAFEKAEKAIDQKLTSVLDRIARVDEIN